MYAESIGILTGLGYAFQAFFVRKGLPNSTSVTAALTAIIAAASFLWIYTILFGSFHFYPVFPNLYFVLAGICTPAIGWPLYFEGIRRMGVSRAGPIVSSAPMFSVLWAALFLGEIPTVGIVGGTVLIVVGVAMISSGSEAKEWRGRDVIYPLASSVLFGTSAIFRKTGIDAIGDPIYGATIAATSGVVFMSIIIFSIGRFGQIKLNVRSCFYFALTGLSISFAYSLYLQALKYSTVNVIAPLVNTGPLFILILTYFFLKELEKLTVKVIVGSLMVSVGAAMVVALK